MSESRGHRRTERGDEAVRPRLGDDEPVNPGHESGGATVLHVDDDPWVGELVEEFLGMVLDGVRVITETDASDGLDRVAERHVDCVVSDLEMPGMDGEDFTRELASRHPQVPVVMFTSRDRATVAEGDTFDHAAEYVQKHGGQTQFETLAEHVRSLVG